MTNSGLIVFLPVVAAVAGGFIGAVATGLVRAWQDGKARQRECKALILRIDAEVYGHILIFESLRKEVPDMTEIDMTGLFTPRTEHWDESRQRLAQLLSVDHMNELVLYYKYLKDTVAATSAKGLAVYRPTTLAKDAGRLLTQAKAIRVEGKKYLKELPSYMPESYKLQQRQS